MNRFAVLLALLLAACATPPPRVPETRARRAAEGGHPRARGAGYGARRPARGAGRTGHNRRAAGPLFREFVARNDEQLLEVFAGMHKSELARIMHADANRWHNPYKREALYDRKGQAYEVLYYLTRDPEGKPVKDRHLTPVIVKDDVVVAIGAYRLKKLKRGESIDLPRRQPKRSS